MDLAIQSPGEPSRRTPSKWRTAFLAALARTSNVAAAACEAGVEASRAYKLRRSDPVFARRWYEALCEGYDNLELELLRRLREGEPEEGAAAGEDGARRRRKFDNAAALRLLAAHRATVGRERGRNDYAYEDEILAAIDAKLERMCQKMTARIRPALPNGAEPGAATDGD